MDTSTKGQTERSILLVDDERSVSTVLERYLSQMGYSCIAAESGSEALEKLKKCPCALALCDIRMPGMDGIELLKRIKEYDEDIAVVMVTAVDERETAMRAIRQGAYDYIIKPFALEEILISAQRALENRRLILDRRDYQRNLETKVQERTRELAEKNEAMRRLFTGAIESIILTLQAKDKPTENHSRRVANRATAIARRLSLPEEEIEDIRLAALLHDIGKVGTSESILNKPGRLTQEESAQLREHPLIATSILEPISPLKGAIAYIKHVHEHYDGSGYPAGLKGEEIPLGARIVAVADAFDAMTSPRPYRPAWETEAVLVHLTKEVGKQFDPMVVEAFLEAYKGKE
jgi:putative two-component system response regulator